jgi:hypothetical protein
MKCTYRIRSANETPRLSNQTFTLIAAQRCRMNPSTQEVPFLPMSFLLTT